MAHINLLPWREELRAQKKKEFIGVTVGTAILMGGVVLLVHLYFAGMIEYQESRNNFLRAEIRTVEASIKEIEELDRQREQLISRMRVIESLQQNRPESVYLFDELARLIPEGLFIETLTQQERNLVINGRAQSNARVSAFMRALDASPRFASPTLDVISTDQRTAERSRQFTLRVAQRAEVKGD
jgi:type IV pilus assembly protein PilN